MRYASMITIGFVLAGICVSNFACSRRVLTEPEARLTPSARPTPTVIEHNTPMNWIAVAGRRPFTFNAPPGIVEKPVQGEDSLVGMWQLDDIELSFDYGMYSSTLDEFSSYRGYSRQDVILDGSFAELVQTDDGHMGIVFPRVPAGQKLTMYASYTEPESRDTVKKMLLSIQFAKQP